MRRRSLAFEYSRRSRDPRGLFIQTAGRLYDKYSRRDIAISREQYLAGIIDRFARADVAHKGDGPAGTAAAAE